LETKTNQFDQMSVDINRLFQNDCVRSRPRFTLPGMLPSRLLNRYTTAILQRLGFYSRLTDSGIIRFWYEEFEEYWSTILNGRPLYFGDFNYLLGVYRQKFQSVETPSHASREAFLESWQNPNTLYQLLGAIRRFAHEPLHCRRFEQWIERDDHILEYGCGIAPITCSLLKYGLKHPAEITIADIRQINSHFARWRLGSSVKFIEVEPYQNSLPSEAFNVVFLITVMEHLPDPLTTIESITKSLRKDGTFVFDYILSDGDGQDTIESAEQRNDVLAYIEQHYKILSGQLTREASMGLTACRRK
jgi:2-polyprenyl-3-methyl-5-hydroxy-6-metoxy-1,4-benzoquinol methylase